MEDQNMNLGQNNPTGASPVNPAPTPPAAPVENNSNNPINNQYGDSAGQKEASFELPTEKEKQNFNVHFMPKDFQNNNRVAGKSGKTTGVLIMVASLVFLVLISAGVYYYLIKPSMEIEEPVAQTPTATPVATPVAEEAAELTTEETTALNRADQVKAVYQEYKVNLTSATTFNDYYTLVQQYGSTNLIQETEADKLANKTLAEVKKASPAFNGTEYLEADVKSSDLAIIKVTLGDKNGIVMMKSENGAWKIESEDWGLFGQEMPSLSDLKTGVDPDSDGLTDAEEILLGTNKTMADTDGDTYADGAEVLNLYDPNGSNKLAASNKFSLYSDDPLGFSLLYPTAWTKNISTEQKLVTFLGDKEHSLQVYILSTTATLDAYYMDSFGVSTISPSARYAMDGWSGIKTGNDLIIYIKAEGEDTIYALQYNIGSSDVLEYKTIYQAMVNSFTIK